MLQLTFKQTDSELMVRAAATVLFSTLKRQKTRPDLYADQISRVAFFLAFFVAAGLAVDGSWRSRASGQFTDALTSRKPA